MKKGRLITNLEDEAYLHLDNTESYYDKLREAHKDLLRETKHGYLNFAYLALCASTLEYSLNHLIVAHFIDDFGPIEYKKYVDGFINIGFANKLHCTPIIITKGKFYFNAEHPTIKSLEELITFRNRILHNKEYLQKVKMDLDKGEVELGMEIQYADPNYLDNLSKEQCIRYGESLGRFKSDFMEPFISDKLIETDLLREKVQ